MSDLLIIGIVFTLLGGLFILLALFLFMRTRMFLAKAQETKGTITEMIAKRGSKGGTSYSPVYEFRTITGQMVKVEESLSTNPPRFQVGQTVDVLYDPENPQSARVKNWMSLYFMSALFGFLGFTFFSIGAGMLALSFLNMPFS